MRNIVVVGSTGTLGKALIEHLSIQYPNALIHAVSRQKHIKPMFDNKNIQHTALSGNDEKVMKVVARNISEKQALDMILVTTGLLHDNEVAPEKSLAQLSEKKFERLFSANTIFPALIAKHFLPKLNKLHHAVFAALSARVGSISDNRSGGWYSYRASKAALNMVIKNVAIEVGRMNKQVVIVGIHPGTVNSQLSKPFQKNVPDHKLFSPEYSAKKILIVLCQLTPKDNGKCFAWDGTEVPA